VLWLATQNLVLIVDIYTCGWRNRHYKLFVIYMDQDVANLSAYFLRADPLHDQERLPELLVPAFVPRINHLCTISHPPISNTPAEMIMDSAITAQLISLALVQPVYLSYLPLFTWLVAYGQSQNFL
jgi:hypothetical protein